MLETKWCATILKLQKYLQSKTKHILEFYASAEEFFMSNYLNEVVAPTKNKTKNKKVVSNQATSSNVQIEGRKTSQPNWEHGEILILVKAKRDEHIANLDIIDGKDKFETVVTKWNKISTQVMNAWFSTQARNATAYKNKWGAFSRDFKKLYVHKIGTRNNQDYWSMNM